MSTAKPDNVNHPSHYTFSKFEVIDVLQEWFSTNPLLWQVVKYVARAEHKNDYLEDLRKAEFYLKREIENEINRRKNFIAGNPNCYRCGIRFLAIGDVDFSYKRIEPACKDIMACWTRTTLNKYDAGTDKAESFEVIFVRNISDTDCDVCTNDIILGEEVFKNTKKGYTHRRCANI